MFEAERTVHSRKPVTAYELIERMYPEFPRIELFARNTRDGWAAWGNQAGHCAEADANVGLAPPSSKRLRPDHDWPSPAFGH